MERLENLSALRAQITYHEHDYPVTIDVSRPNLVRSTGGERYISVFDGERAAFLHYVDRDGIPSDPFLVDEEEVKDWEAEIAWIFPAYFDHPSEYLGLRSVEGDSLHVLQVILPLGVRMEYCLDPLTFLLRRAEAYATIRGVTHHSGRIYHDYRDVEGVKYPSHMEFFYGEGKPQPAVFETVEFDVEFPPEHFLIPENLR